MRIASAVIAFLFEGAAALAQPVLVVQLESNGFQLLNSPTPFSATRAWTGSYPLAPGATGSGSATGGASFGLLTGSSYDQQSGGWLDYFGSRSSSGSAWIDDVLVTPSNPALMGTPGSLTVSLHVTGQLSASFTGSVWSGFDMPTAAAGVAVAVDSSYVGFTNDYVQVGGAGPQSQSLSVNRHESMIIPFTYGQWFSLNVILNTQTYLQSPIGAQPGVDSASASASQWSCAWDGVTGVMSQDGPLEIGAISMSSSSGANYLVPAPGSGVALGLAIIGLRRRRR